MLRRTLLRRYYHDVPSDLVPAGGRASRFQSSGTPSTRSNIVLEHMLAPAFGNAGPALATLAIAPTCRAAEFVSRFRPGLLDVLNEQLLLVDDAAVDTKLTLSTVIRAEHCPWNNKNGWMRQTAGGGPDADGSQSFVGNCESRCCGIEVNVTLTPTKKNTTTTAPLSDGDTGESDETQMIVDAFLDLQERLLNLVVDSNNIRRNNILLAHGIVGAAPSGLVETRESELLQWHGRDVSLSRVEASASYWAERAKLASGDK